MGTKIYDLVEKHEITLAELKHKVIAIDTYLFLYQFLATIRQSDGRLLTDSKGNVTSHLIGLFSRSVNFMSQGIRLAFVFDGEPPKLKEAVREQRREAKMKAQELLGTAMAAGDVAAIRKYSARTGALSEEMVNDTKELLHSLGLPVVQAPGEGEAQAAHMVKKGDAYAVGSNDADALLFGALRIVKNLGITSRRKKAMTTEKVPLELIDLRKTLECLGISQEQLIYLAMLVGTDYNSGGIKGIGPKKAIELIKKYSNPEILFSSVNWEFPYSWEEVFNAIKNAKVTDGYSLAWNPVNRQRIFALLCDRHDFNKESVEKTLAAIKPQSTLGGFL